MGQSGGEASSRGAMFLVVGAGAFALVCMSVLGGATYYATTQRGHGTTPKVTIGIPGSQDAAKLSGSMDGSSYVPTSQYVEKGADADVMTLGFDGGGGGSSGAHISEDEIQTVMYHHQMDMIECYSDGLADDPEMAGRVDFHFRVAGDGHVAMVKITDSGLEDKPTEDCLVQSARRWQFPETGNKQLVKFDTDFEFACE